MWTDTTRAQYDLSVEAAAPCCGSNTTFPFHQSFGKPLFEFSSIASHLSAKAVGANSF